MGKNPYQEDYFSAVGAKPVAYNPIFALILSSPTAAIFLSQLLYWEGKGRNPNWVYKTIKEIEEETGLTQYQQKTAIRKCLGKGVIRTKLAGIPARRHFQIDFRRLDELILDYAQNGKPVDEPARQKFDAAKKSVSLRRILVSGRVRNLYRQTPHSSLGNDPKLIQIVPTDNTSEIKSYRFANVPFATIKNKNQGLGEENITPDQIARLTAHIGKSPVAPLEPDDHGGFPYGAYDVCLRMARTCPNYVQDADADGRILKELFEKSFTIFQICRDVKKCSQNARDTGFGLEDVKNALFGSKAISDQAGND